MKALTLKQPWAWCVCCLGKRIENRTWKPPASLVGDYIAVHGGKFPTRPDDAMEILHETRGIIEDYAGIMTVPPDATLQSVKDCSGIVAIARLAAVVTESDDPWFEGPFGWVLADVFVLPRPIPCKGAQGLWKVPDEHVEDVRRQWRAVREAETQTLVESGVAQ